MRFLIDNALSPAVAEGLRQAGHDAVHVRDRSLQDATDSLVYACAQAEERVLVSADSDFGTILAHRRESRPSVVLFRRGVPVRPARQVVLLLTNLPKIADALDLGSVIVFDGMRIRIRSLPIEDS